MICDTCKAKGKGRIYTCAVCMEDGWFEGKDEKGNLIQEDQKEYCISCQIKSPMDYTFCKDGSLHTGGVIREIKEK